MRCKPSVPLGRVIWIIGSCCWSTETQAIAQLFDILLQVVFGATVCFFFFYSPWRIYDGYDQCFYLWHFLRSSPLIFWCCNLPRALVLHCQPCSVLQEIACVSGYGSQWHNEIHFLVNARWVDSVCVCVCMDIHFIWESIFNYIPIQGCMQISPSCFLMQKCSCHIFIGWTWAQMALM